MGFIINPYNFAVATFDPSTILGCKAWYDASDSTSITKDGGNLVSQWNDKSGQANHVVQATGSKQPLWVSAGQNGKDIIRFDGVDNILKKATFTGGEVVQGNMVFFVFKKVSGTISGYVYDSGADTDRQTFLMGIVLSGKFGFISGDGSTGVGSSNTAETNYNYWDITWNGASNEVFKNAVSYITGNATNVGTDGMNGITFGARNSDSGFANVEFAEFILYDTVLSSGNRTLVRNYLSAKWGL